MDSRYDAGMKVRTEVLGAEHVARARAQQTDLDADFQRFITETAWGSVWTRPNLDRRTRSLVTIGILAALGREELALHLRASRNIGVDPKEIVEVLFHVAIYAGIPAANAAFAMAKTHLGGKGEPSWTVPDAIHPRSRRTCTKSTVPRRAAHRNSRSSRCRTPCPRS